MQSSLWAVGSLLPCGKVAVLVVRCRWLVSEPLITWKVKPKL